MRPQDNLTLYGSPLKSKVRRCRGGKKAMLAANAQIIWSCSRFARLAGSEGMLGFDAKFL